jgi:hypothetical protein
MKTAEEKVLKVTASEKAKPTVRGTKGRGVLEAHPGQRPMGVSTLLGGPTKGVGRMTTKKMMVVAADMAAVASAATKRKVMSVLLPRARSLRFYPVGLLVLFRAEKGAGEGGLQEGVQSVVVAVPAELRAWTHNPGRPCHQGQEAHPYLR